MERINNLAVVIIDMQEPFMLQVEKSSMDTIISNQKKLISICKMNRIPIAVVEYYALGETHHEIRSLLKGCITKTFEKKQASAFSSREFISYLKLGGIKNLLISGLFGNACVYATSLSASKNGYTVITAEDLIAMNSHLYQEQRISGNSSFFDWYKWNTKFLPSFKELTRFELKPSKIFYIAGLLRIF